MRHEQEYIIKTASDQIAICKSRVDKNQCNLNKCKNCEYGNIIANLENDFTEEEIIYIYGLAKMKYTKGKMEELKEKDRIMRRKRKEAKEMAPFTITLAVFSIFGLFIFAWLFSLG